MNNLPALVTLVACAFVLFAIGLWAPRLARSEEGFLLASRNLGPWVAGLA